MPNVAVPERLAAPGVRRPTGMLRRELGRRIPGRAADRRHHRSDSQQPGSARRRRARRSRRCCCAKLAGAKLYPSVDVLARGGAKLSGDNSGMQGARPHRELGARSLGPRALRPRRGDGGRRVDRGRLRVRAPVDGGGGRQELVPRHRGRPAGGAGAGDDPRRRRPRAPGRDARRVSASATTKTSSSPARSVGTYRDVLREIELARDAGDARPRTPAGPLSRRGGGA